MGTKVQFHVIIQILFLFVKKSHLRIVLKSRTLCKHGQIESDDSASALYYQQLLKLNIVTDHNKDTK